MVKTIDHATPYLFVTTPSFMFNYWAWNVISIYDIWYICFWTWNTSSFYDHIGYGYDYWTPYWTLPSIITSSYMLKHWTWNIISMYDQNINLVKLTKMVFFQIYKCRADSNQIGREETLDCWHHMLDVCDLINKIGIYLSFVHLPLYWKCLLA